MTAVANAIWTVLISSPMQWLIEHWAWWSAPIFGVFVWHYRKCVEAGDRKASIRDKLVEHIDSTKDRTEAMIATINRDKYTYPDTREAMAKARNEFEAMRSELATLNARSIVSALRKWHQEMFDAVDRIEREDAAAWQMLQLGTYAPFTSPQHIPLLQNRVYQLELLLKRTESLRLFPWWTWPLRP